MEKYRPHLVVSDKEGKIYDIPHLEGVGMKGGALFRLTAKDLIKLPPGSELFMLPARKPVCYDPDKRNFTVLERYPLSKIPKEIFAVGAFVSPGYTVTYNSAFAEIGRVRILPLFSYAAVFFQKGEFYVSCVRVDRELRQDLRYMDICLVRRNFKRYKKTFGKNRLIGHLGKCALDYGCPAAKNFFLGRYEAPLPTSPSCNALCAGCISFQPRRRCPVTQPRIKFIPTPEEISEIAVFHIGNVRDPVVSFGQGCEGEPLLAGKVLEKAIRLIRRETRKGIININTNASKPGLVGRLFDAGLDSIRVSMNSARPLYYNRYYKPRGYAFTDVLRSIAIAKKKKGFVSINYLVMPGFTDAKGEIRAFRDFLNRYRIDMIQWRNLNYDPLRYFLDLKIGTDPRDMLGMKELVNSIRKEFPEIMTGYFNPSKERIKRHFAHLNFC